MVATAAFKRQRSTARPCCGPLISATAFEQSAEAQRDGRQGGEKPSYRIRLSYLILYYIILYYIILYYIILYYIICFRRLAGGCEYEYRGGRCRRGLSASWHAATAADRAAGLPQHSRQAAKRRRRPTVPGDRMESRSCRRPLKEVSKRPSQERSTSIRKMKDLDAWHIFKKIYNT